MTTGIQVEALSKSFSTDGPPALDNVSFRVDTGDCVAVLGPSGSGKSTLLRTIAGLAQPDQGRISVAGRDVTDVLPEKRGMAMVSQRPLLFPHLNVIHNIAFAATVAGTRPRAARADALQFLRMVQLDGFDTRPISSLSGGQQQRVALARALASRPDVLLLDEPFSALDQELRHDMQDLLRQLRQIVQPTVLLVTHDRDEAATVADTIALISGGRLIQHGTVQELYRRPASIEASRLMGGKNEIGGTVIRGMHHSPWGTFPITGCSPCADGPATMVIRQESIELLGEGASGVLATVTAVRPVGARRLVTVTRAETVLHAETTAFRTMAVGDPIRVRIPSDELAVIPTRASVPA
jgi:putative spermidine/putrescine transport system ATP-binding protein